MCGAHHVFLYKIAENDAMKFQDAITTVSQARTLNENNCTLKNNLQNVTESGVLLNTNDISFKIMTQTFLLI